MKPVIAVRIGLILTIAGVLSLWGVSRIPGALGGRAWYGISGWENPTMMGLGLPLSGQGGWLSGRAVDRLARVGEAGAEINRRTNTITYFRSTVMLVALAPPHGEPNMTWEIDGLVNPTVRIRAGTRLTVTVINMDWGYLHGLELTPTPPPYSYMAMMTTRNDGMVPPLPERSAKNLTIARYASASLLLTLRPGTYDYLCPVPGHAAEGMYGRLVVL